MEIAKFVLSCVGSFIAVTTFFMGFWKAYTKKMDDKIKTVQANADEKIQSVEDESRLKIETVEKAAAEEIEKVRTGSIAKTEKLEKRIESLEKSVIKLQEDLNANVGQRLSNIEGEMKGMSNILKQIQGWFINNTPRN